LALVGEPFRRPGQTEDLHRLDRSAQPLANRHAEHPELLLTPPEPEPKDESAAGDEVDCGRVLRQAKWVVERCEHHPGPELDVFGRGGERCECREQRSKIAVAGAVVLAHPRRVESQGLREADEIQHLPILLREGPRRARGQLEGEVVVPDLQRCVAVYSYHRCGAWVYTLRIM